MQIEPITATIGAELVGINLRDAAQDDGLVRIYKTPEHEGRKEKAWHHDNTWRAVASKACVLRCVQCPSVGGDTLWASMALAYEKLPESVKAENAHADEQAGDSTLIRPLICGVYGSHHFML